jgi:protoporphyrinogen oxidase
MRIAIIGAGPAGLTAAYQLAKGGAEVEVFEASETVGGLARSVERWGQRVDIGPHRFFSDDLRVNRLWLEVVGRDYRMVDRQTRIFYNRRFFDYPLRPANALWNMGAANAGLCLSSYLKEKVAPSFHADNGGTFESWVVGRFGRRLYNMFFKSYSEKLWGIPCSELDADFAAQRIKKFSLGEALKSALGLGNGKHKTLVNQFAYPTGGSGMVYERMAERIQRRGGKVHLNCPVRRLVHDGPSVGGVEFTDGNVAGFDHVISTMPLTLLVRRLDGVPKEVLEAVDGLRFRNTILIYLHVNAAKLFPDQWLYIHSPDLQTGRITNFRNWVPELYGTAQTSILALEYWAYDEDPLWQEQDSKLIDLAAREVRSTGLIGDAPVLDGDVVRLRRCYPVYARGYKDKLAPVISYLNTFRGLSVIGRYGAFKYNNQDHSILMGILAAQNLLEGTKHDLWAVNTDYETYQEAATITATGLRRAGSDVIEVVPAVDAAPDRVAPAQAAAPAEALHAGEN